MNFKWHCPYCNHYTTILDSNFHQGGTALTIENKNGHRYLLMQFIVCPNIDCNEYTLTAFLYEYKYRAGSWRTGDLLQQWNLIPPSEAKAMPNYIPIPIINDYQEACLIRDLSPKASATLSRRCLQGIVRDYWGVKKERLVDEIDEIKDKIDPLTWKAIEAVRKIGNIGAHMEKDINLVIEVEPEESKKLIQLIELLISEWYINRYEREKNLNEIIGISIEKDEQKQGEIE